MTSFVHYTLSYIIWENKFISLKFNFLIIIISARSFALKIMIEKEAVKKLRRKLCLIRLK